MPSKDSEGRVYYYQVNGEASAWELPEVEPATRQSFEALDVTYRRRSPNLSLRNSKCQSMLTSSPRNSQTNLAAPTPLSATGYGLPPPPMFHVERSASVQSRESVSSSGDDFSWPAPPTPTTDGGNFFQEIEKTRSVKSEETGGRRWKEGQKPGLPHGKPESCCVLQGASLEWAPSASTKKKNAFQIRAVTGLVFLLQHDHQMEASNWFSAIAAVIKRLGVDGDGVLDEPGTPTSLQPVELIRTRSRRDRGSERDENKSNIREKLRKLISKRPPIEELEKKGIIKESVFGCHIGHLCERQKNTSACVCDFMYCCYRKQRSVI
ncbi:Rho GTPase-activating protein 9 [Desmophyllum pertusum]|uniref:Rho GTPase-activating protein 9 n=1 Tax=Desmophyllum pertusum TaxID=174260 RepID=A0A9W9YQD5_9CNID|nr:Rho GTPase-activating protein 9 [Desmophyllum pertusum]